LFLIASFQERHELVFCTVLGGEHPALTGGAERRPVQADTTMTYTHVLNKGGKGVRSPMDKL
jgi:hypothetical protein